MSGVRRRWLSLLVVAALATALVLSLGADPAPSERPGKATPTEVGAAQAPMVSIPAGSFTMGDDAGHFDERPAHTVRLGAYLIDRYEVSNADFERFARASGVRVEGPWRRGLGEGAGGAPVRYVSWHDARAYCASLGKRLPTEAEWERAARGPDGRTYPWGDEWRDGVAQAGRSAESGPAAVGTHSEGASPEGAEDLAGNVWEWTADWYDRWLYGSRVGRVIEAPTGPADGAQPETRFVARGTAAGNERSTLKVIRGGGWSGEAAELLRSSKRMFARPDTWSHDTGFRCVADVVARGGGGGGSNGSAER